MVDAQAEILPSFDGVNKRRQRRADDGGALLSRCPRFADLPEDGADGARFEALRRAETIGRPLAGDGFIAALETPTR